MSHTVLALVEGHVVNVGDISTVAPFTSYTPGLPDSEPGVKLTFRSKGTSLFIPGLTPDTFMDKLVAATARIDLPD